MNKVYAFSDLHGMYNLWKQIKEHCDESDTLIFLGDAADRGPDGLKIIKELLADKKVIYLKGNHEEFLIEVGLELLEGRTAGIPLWKENGGEPTYNALLGEPEEDARRLLSRLEKLPESMEYTNKKGQTIFLSHAGCPITGLYEYRLSGHKIDYLWDRKHLNWDPYYPNEINEKSPYIVHGHTPTPILSRYMFATDSCEVCFYCEGHKVDIDLGCFATKKIALLDLDTFEPIYFYTKES